MAATDVVQLKQQFAERTGLDASLLGQSALAGFVRRRCVALGIADELAYYALAIQDPDEADRLVHEVSVAETWFFRYPSSFEVLRQHATELLSRRRNQLRMLSIACATGEEPYGMAMAATEAGWPLNRIAVDAFDRHEASLSIARKACYRSNSFRDAKPAWAEKWFQKTADATRVDPRVVAAVRFARRDVVGDLLPVENNLYDFVCCRNLFIYLSQAARGKLVDFLRSVTAADGLLLVGHAEVGILPADAFVPLAVPHAFALRRKHPEAVTPNPAPIVDWPRAAAGQHVVTTAEPPPVPVVIPVVEEARGAATLEEARAMADAGQLDQAIAVLNEIATRTSASPDLFSLLGSIQLSKGELSQAKDAFSKVLYIDPRHEAALLQMAIVSDRLGLGEQASRFRRRAARAHETSPCEPRTEAT